MEFAPGVRVGVKVVDSRGKPLSDVRVECVYENGFHWVARGVTGSEGMTGISVPVHSRGRFRTVCADRQAETFIEEAVPYEVAGPEDAGREFTLPLSDKMIQRLSEQIP